MIFENRENYFTLNISIVGNYYWLETKVTELVQMCKNRLDRQAIRNPNFYKSVAFFTKACGKPSSRNPY